MIEKLLSLLSDQEAMLPQDDRLSHMITEAEASSETEKTELFEDELEMVQAALKNPEKPGKS